MVWLARADTITGSAMTIHEEQRARIAILWLALLVTVVGCDMRTDDVHGSNFDLDDVAHHAFAPESTRTENAAPHSIILEHDFGLLRPRETVENVFRIENTSDESWTVRTLTETCTCTVAKMSAQRILPGDFAECTVRLSIPESSRDLQQRVLISFNEQNSPFVEMVVKASVRQHLIVKPSRLEFASTTENQVLTSGLTVQQFVGVDQGFLELSTGHEWLTYAVSTVSMAKPSEHEPHGVIIPDGEWRLTVNAHFAKIPIGHHESFLKIKCNAGKNYHETIVPVLVRKESPVKVIPSQLFLGRIQRGETAYSSAALRFSEDTMVASPDEILLTENFHGDLTLKLTSITSHEFQIDATFACNGRSPDGVVKGEIIVHSSLDKFSDFSIPVVGRISEKE